MYFIFKENLEWKIIKKKKLKMKRLANRGMPLTAPEMIKLSKIIDDHGTKAFYYQKMIQKVINI